MTGDGDEGGSLESPAGRWFRRISKPLRTLGGQVVGAAVTTVTLSVGYMFFNDYIAPAPELAGRWKFTVVYEDTGLAEFDGLRVTYEALLIQEGLDLSGTGEKLSDRGPGIEPVDYDSSRRTDIEIMGTITRNYFSLDALVIHYREAGRRRESSTLHELEYFDAETMCGCFESTIADTAGSVWWGRVDDRNGIYEPVARPGVCGDVDCGRGSRIVAAVRAGARWKRRWRLLYIYPCRRRRAGREGGRAAGRRGETRRYRIGGSAMTQRAIEDLRLIETYPRAPVKRAAYSDRTAWLMAVLSELAYTRFDQDDDSSILALARELAELTDRERIAERLRDLAAMLGATGCGSRVGDNALLRECLAAGGFELKFCSTPGRIRRDMSL